jgi:glucose-6-phosphate 1-dehydrogenase
MPTTVPMDFSYGASFAGAPAEAYERLLYDALVDDHTLFIREHGIERSWDVVAPAVEHPGPIHPYPAGSWGPAAAGDLLGPRRCHPE